MLCKLKLARILKLGRESHLAPGPPSGPRSLPAAVLLGISEEWPQTREQALPEDCRQGDWVYSLREACPAFDSVSETVMKSKRAHRDDFCLVCV